MSRWTDISLALLIGVSLAGCNSQPVRDTAETATVTSAAPNVDVAAELRQARLQFEGGMLGSARDTLQSLSEAAPGEPLAWLNLGLVHLRMEQPEKAVASLEKAVDLAPALPAAHNLLGIAYRRAGRIDEAREAYTTALRNDPGYALAHYNLAVLFDIYLQQPAKAIQHYRRYESLAPQAGSEVSLWISQLEASHAD